MRGRPFHLTRLILILTVSNVFFFLEGGGPIKNMSESSHMMIT